MVPSRIGIIFIQRSSLNQGPNSEVSWGYLSLLLDLPPQRGDGVDQVGYVLVHQVLGRHANKDTVPGGPVLRACRAVSAE